MERIISYIKNRRKQLYLTMKYDHKYAFIGIGGHSISNLYPVINYFRIPLKYIVTHSSDNASVIDTHFENVKGTHDLNEVLNDKEIKGIFICAQPKKHFELIKRCLIADKNIFVEKPPCYTISELNELIELEKKSNGSVLIGFQKQYAPSYLQLKEKAVENSTYNYRYVTGAYPDGDPYTELFIHSISLFLFMFGDIASVKITKQKQNNTLTLFMHLIHKKGITGSIELSTAYSWKNPLEKMIFNSPDGVYELNNSENLSFEPKDKTIFGIPLDKVFKGNNNLITINQRNNFVPLLTNNQLYTSGYFTEIKNYIDMSENKKFENFSTLKSCLSTYELIEKLKLE